MMTDQEVAHIMSIRFGRCIMYSLTLNAGSVKLCSSKLILLVARSKSSHDSSHGCKCYSKLLCWTINFNRRGFMSQANILQISWTNQLMYQIRLLLRQNYF